MIFFHPLHMIFMIPEPGSVLGFVSVNDGVPD